MSLLFKNFRHLFQLMFFFFSKMIIDWKSFISRHFVDQTVQCLRCLTPGTLCGSDCCLSLTHGTRHLDQWQWSTGGAPAGVPATGGARKAVRQLIVNNISAHLKHDGTLSYWVTLERRDWTFLKVSYNIDVGNFPRTNMQSVYKYTLYQSFIFHHLNL